MKYIVFTILALMLTPAGARAAGPLRIGVTLPAYYSFVAQIVGQHAEVVPVLEPGVNAHNYQPRPEDIKRVMGLDALVVNGIGHDEFVFDLLDAARVTDTLPVIYANEGVALIPVAGASGPDQTVNTHTFLSISASIQQIHTISRALMRLDSEHAAAYQRNTRAYTSRLRKLKAEYLRRLAEIPITDFRCATVHGAYGYLLQEFGLYAAAVIEPRHGLKPTASQLKDTIATLEALDVDVIFAERDFPDQYVETIQQATGARVYALSHITGIPYTKTAFEELMRDNMETLVTALRDTYQEHTTP